MLHVWCNLNQRQPRTLSNLYLTQASNMAELSVELETLFEAGFALAQQLYDFSITIGSSGAQLRSLSIDVGLFSSVLSHFTFTVSNTRDIRTSASALQTTKDVIQRCLLIFSELEVIVVQIRGTSSSLQHIRFKWWFSKSKIAVILEQMSTCLATLHLMLVTMLSAQSFANDAAFENPRPVAEPSETLPPYSPRRPPDGQLTERVVQEHPANSFPRPPMVSIRRADCVLSMERYDDFNLSNLDERQTAVLQANRLLLEWLREDGNPVTTEHRPCPLCISTVLCHDPQNRTLLGDMQVNQQAHQTAYQIQPTQNDSVLLASKDTICNMVCDSIRIGKRESCSGFLPRLLKKYNIRADPSDYSLFAVWNGLERELMAQENPLQVFRELKRQDNKTMLMLRKKAIS